METMYVIDAFFNRSKAKSGYLKADSGVLIDTTTVIAVYDGSFVYLNKSEQESVTLIKDIIKLKSTTSDRQIGIIEVQESELVNLAKFFQ